MDVIHNGMKWADYNRGTLLGLILAVLACVWLVGCPATTQSLIRPGETVDAPALEREIITQQAAFDVESAAIAQRIAEYNTNVDAFNAKIEAAATHLQEQYEQRAAIVETLGSLVGSIASGGFSPAAGIGAVISLAGLGLAGGLGYDNIRKRKVIKTLKANGAAVPGSTLT